MEFEKRREKKIPTNEKTIIPPSLISTIINKLKGVKIRSDNPLDKSCLEPNPVTQFQPPFTEPREQRASFPFPLETISFATFMPHTISNSLHLDGVKRAKERKKMGGAGWEKTKQTIYT